MITSRVLAATAEAGMLPHKVASSNKSGVPAVAITIVSAIAIAIACFPQFTEQLVNLGSIFTTITMTFNSISLIVARKKFPYPEDCFKAPARKLLPFLTMAILYTCYIPNIIKGGAKLWIFSIAWYALGAVFLLYYFRNRKKELVENQETN